MRIAIMGAGALGSVLGALLSKKNDVLLITRGEHLKRIREKGLRVDGLTSGTFFLDSSEFYPGGYDLIIFTVKAYQTEDAVKEIKKEYDDEVVITFQNGVGIEKYLVALNLIPGSTSIGATLIEPGKVKHAGMGNTYIGEINGEITERVRKIAENFSDCGLRTEVVKDIMERRWVKAAVNACINPLTAILRVKNGELKNENLDPLVRCVANECEKVLKERGINVNVYHKARKVIENTADNISSMAQDIMHGKRTEVDFILKPFVEDKCTSMLYRMVKFVENRL